MTPQRKLMTLLHAGLEIEAALPEPQRLRSFERTSPPNYTALLLGLQDGGKHAHHVESQSPRGPPHKPLLQMPPPRTSSLIIPSTTEAITIPLFAIT